jgi:MFS family permease
MALDAQAQSDADNRLGLLSRVLTISILVGIFAVTVGGTPVLLGVSMVRHGWSNVAIGLSAASSPLGIVIASLVAPAASERFGAVIAAVLSCLGGLLAFALMATSYDLPVWICARVLWGFSVGTFYILNKVWLSQIVHTAIRGRAFGIYNSFLSAGFSAGPLVVSLVDFDMLIGLAILGSAFLVCAFGVLLSRQWLPNFKRSSQAPLFGVIPLLPVALLCAGAFGAFDHMTYRLCLYWGLATAEA